MHAVNRSCPITDQVMSAYSVRALFEVMVMVLNVKEKERIQTELYKQRQGMSASQSDSINVSKIEATSDNLRDFTPPKGEPFSYLPEKSNGDSIDPFLSSLISGITNKNLPPPSTDENKWWDRSVDTSQIPLEGTATNPFYNFEASEFKKQRPAPPPPAKSSKFVSINLMD
jgi:hypothetical protein